MNQQLIIDQLLQWVENFVEKPHPSLGGWPPCPYARQARVNNKLEIKFTNVQDFEVVLSESKPLLESKDIVVICFDHTTINPAELQKKVNDLNHLLMPQNYVILEDHPDNLEFVHGVNMNFGHCGLLLFSKLSVLNDASNNLREKGYYKNWSGAELEYVVDWRIK